MAASGPRGCTWAIVACARSAKGFGTIVWGGVIASPLIGLVVAAIYLSFYQSSAHVRWLGALLTLSIAVTVTGYLLFLWPMTYATHRPLGIWSGVA